MLNVCSSVQFYANLSISIPTVWPVQTAATVWTLNFKLWKRCLPESCEYYINLGFSLFPYTHHSLTSVSEWIAPCVKQNPVCFVVISRRRKAASTSKPTSLSNSSVSSRTTAQIWFFTLSKNLPSPPATNAPSTKTAEA